jgi:hypothetical protein
MAGRIAAAILRDMRPVRQVGIIAPALLGALGPLGALDTLEHVLRAGLDVVEIVVQDEYTHDVITRRGAAPVWICFDTT